MELADIPRLVSDLNGSEPDSDNPRYPPVLAELKPKTSGSSVKST